MYTTTLSQANCRKVFVQRDFSEGRVVRFASRFPVELEGKIDRQLFDYTNITLNSWYAEVEKGSCSTYCEGCMACPLPTSLQVWTKRGLLLTDPV